MNLQSEEINELTKALVTVQGSLPSAKKDNTNPFFKSKYITLDNIIETYNPLLNELNLVCYHYTKDNKLTTVILDIKDESKVESEFNVLNTDPQKQGSEITYWKRYNLGQLLNIQTDTDDDANIASKATQTKTTTATPNTQTTGNTGTCKDCWAVNKLSQAGKPYCSELCWKS